METVGNMTSLMVISGHYKGSVSQRSAAISSVTKDIIGLYKASVVTEEHPLI